MMGPAWARAVLTSQQAPGDFEADASEVPQQPEDSAPTGMDTLTRELSEDERFKKRRPIKSTPYALRIRDTRYDFYVVLSREEEIYDSQHDTVTPETYLEGYTEEDIPLEDAVLLFHKSDFRTYVGLPMRVQGSKIVDSRRAYMLYGYGSVSRMGPLDWTDASA